MEGGNHKSLGPGLFVEDRNGLVLTSENRNEPISAQKEVKEMFHSVRDEVIIVSSVSESLLLFYKRKTFENMKTNRLVW